ncbi:Putative Chromo-like domain superfamily protein [Colletotrichum destructivum]|uniref:Chromo-like domain superfamily protein n=1 Tax=Colletotrichum destructivum TaxID=34406 RepID=A0AAX4I0D5_9PEZI|nr:Putative Chromo-like domain superfamily protein [Colletotrichum destructivum]
MRVQKGTAVDAAWSSRLDVTDVICTFASGSRVFYGVVAEVPDPLVWDWPDDRQLLWVYDDGNSVKVWQECVERPRPSNPAWASCLRSIVGCYENDGGNVSYAVRWNGYACPTWEAEEDMSNYSHLLAEHDRACKCRGRS